MRKHMTHGELVKIRKMLSNGVTDLAVIQAAVPIHSECIENAAKQFLADAKAKKAPAKKAAAKKAVNPIS